MLIAIKIDVTKLEKARFFTGKTGAVYADLLLNVKDDFAADQYGNCGFIVQSVTKEEREAGTKLPICGNAKVLIAAKPAAPARPATTPPPANDFTDEGSVPF